jgi:hypothetical protein
MQKVKNAENRYGGSMTLSSIDQNAQTSKQSELSITELQPID